MPKKQTEWSRAYNEKAYDRLYVTVPKGRKSTIEALAKERGESSINGLINAMLRDAAGLTDAEWKEAQDEKEWKFIVPADIVPKSEE